MWCKFSLHSLRRNWSKTQISEKTIKKIINQLFLDFAERSQFPHEPRTDPLSKDVCRNLKIDFTLLLCDLSMSSSEWVTLRYLILAAIIIIMDYSTMEYVTSSCGVSARKICTACALKLFQGFAFSCSKIENSFYFQWSWRANFFSFLLLHSSYLSVSVQKCVIWHGVEINDLSCFTLLLPFRLFFWWKLV